MSKGQLLLLLAMGVSLVYPDASFAQPELEVTGIIGGDTPSALVNGELVSAGDEINGAKVIGISRAAVTFEYKGAVIIKALEEETGEKEYVPPRKEVAKKRRRKVEEPAEAEYPVSEPAVPKCFAGKPHFFTRKGSFTAGAAFLLQMGGKPLPVLVTAQHIFASARGLKQRAALSDLPKYVTKVVLSDFVSGVRLKAAVEEIPIAAGQKTKLDLVAFRLTPDGGCTPGKLAGRNPAVNETVWLAAPAKSGAPKGRLLHKAAVTGINGDRARCLFENRNLVLRGVSGAPYLNSAGEVVGMHIESSKKQGKITASFVPAESIRRAIESAEQ